MCIRDRSNTTASPPRPAAPAGAGSRCRQWISRVSPRRPATPAAVPAPTAPAIPRPPPPGGHPPTRPESPTGQPAGSSPPLPSDVQKSCPLSPRASCRHLILVQGRGHQRRPRLVASPIAVAPLSVHTSPYRKPTTGPSRLSVRGIQAPSHSAVTRYPIHPQVSLVCDRRRGRARIFLQEPIRPPG